MTDVDREALPYLEGFKEDVAKYLGLSTQELDGMWRPTEARILASPGEFGWQDEARRIVAPATADPLILTRVIADQILRGLLENPENLGLAHSLALTRALPQDDAARSELLQNKFFTDNYGKLETHFRPGAADFLHSLLKLGRLTVITNSDTRAVQAKLAKLREKYSSLPGIDVIGEAKKYLIVPDFFIDGIAAQLNCSPHLVRFVFTQRKKYYDVLKAIGIFDADSRVIAGDVWELDLMLPILLQIKGAFITRSMTPEHEKALVRQEMARGMAMISDDLEGLLADIKLLHGI